MGKSRVYGPIEYARAKGGDGTLCIGRSIQAGKAVR